jgi:hypothetical protein
MVFQIVYHRNRGEGFLYSEFMKYYVAYSRRYFLLIPPILAVVFAVYIYMRSKRLDDYVVISLMAVLATLLLTVTSGSKSWHHLVVVPSWAILIGASVRRWYEIKENINDSTKPRCCIKVIYVVNVVVALAFLNGLIISIITPPICTYLTSGRGNALHLEQRVTKYIPDGSVVYGDRSLIFYADRHKWKFVGDYGGIFNTDMNAIDNMGLEWVVIRVGSDWAPLPTWLKNKQWTLVSEYTMSSATIDDVIAKHPWLGKIFYNPAPITYHIYKKTQDNDN